MTSVPQNACGTIWHTDRQTDERTDDGQRDPYVSPWFVRLLRLVVACRMVQTNALTGCNPPPLFGMKILSEFLLFFLFFLGGGGCNPLPISGLNGEKLVMRGCTPPPFQTFLDPPIKPIDRLTDKRQNDSKLLVCFAWNDGDIFFVQVL